MHAPMFTGVPLAVRFPASFRHLPRTSKRTGPVGPWSGAAATVQPNAAEPEVPAAPDALIRREKFPVRVSQPVICPLALRDTPGGSPVAVNVSVCPGTGMAWLSCKPTGSPITCFWLAGSSRDRIAGLAWSRSVWPGSEIPATVPVLVYCQLAQVLQPAGSAGPAALEKSGTHTGVRAKPVLLPVHVPHQDCGV